MSKHQSPDPIALFGNQLPEWSHEADEIYQNYHFLNLALRQTEGLVIPEDALQKLLNLKELLVGTIAQLIQDLPPASHRISNGNSESASRFNAHTNKLKDVNLQTDVLLQELLQQYPSLKNWFESLSNE